MAPDRRLPAWRKSSHSGGEGGNCIEVHRDLNVLRDSKNPSVVLCADIGPFLEAIKSGRLGR
ncbi:DUF397 domain-containing protein [Kibdelosporangium philippinense]|uniref:DUF397 domain-containing protein n=1 Tax=Kibdelosporangium philippinense TaxID=211113 RepID=A0ABS8ZQD3_9PSEU|nr:DUF397 domain-containing protein [Kibdelosporangium philippinense]MCE7009961.1 DUF397 domain-containing protein [Kibdelosporangium philippinense]